jgi:protein gp37
MSSKIIWTDETWNPIVGCSHCSPGCDHCYAERMAHRQAAMVLNKSPCPDITKGQGRYVAVIGPKGKWNGSTVIDNGCDKDSEMNRPHHMKKPRWIFVCSMSDFFHENNSDKWIEKVFDIIYYAYWHTYILLTKRPKRMHDFIKRHFGGTSPGKNVWCGVTVCNQKETDEKIPVLLQTPAEVRFISIEPMLGPIDLYRGEFNFLERLKSPSGTQYEKLDWLIVGGESGPDARPMNPDWVRSVRDQCAAAGVPFLFKQWGDAKPSTTIDKINMINAGWNLNKKKGGLMLDGKIHDGYPEEK